MTGGELLIRALRDRGVQFITTVCGNGLNPILEACRVLDMRVIDARTEDAASYIAESYARLTGRLGVATSSSGIAHINAMAGVLNSYYDGSPFLLITGESPQEGTDLGKFQELDHGALLQPLCKYVRRVTRTELIPFYVNEAIAHATSSRPGPVHLSIPADLTAADIDKRCLPRVDITSAVVQPSGAGEVTAIQEAAHVLAHSRRPLIVAGSGAFYAGAGEELMKLAKLCGVPVTTLIWDRGVVPKSVHCVGVVGAATGQPDVLAQADTILVVGGRIDYRLGYGRSPELSNASIVIRIDADPNELHQGLAPKVGIVGNPKTILASINAEYRRINGPTHLDWLAKAQRANLTFREKWHGHDPSLTPPMTGRHRLDTLVPFITANVTFLVDGGNIG